MPRLPVDRGATAEEMAQTIFGEGVSIESATYTGDNNASGVYTNGDTISPGVTPGDSGVILSTGNARNFTNRNGEYNQDTNQSSNMNGVDNDPTLNALAGANTYDAAMLEVEFIPTGDTLTMQFVFASEEYPEYVNSIYQDFVAVSINGVFVPMEIGNGDVDPGNINGGENESLFIDNTGDAYNTEMDGFTMTMTLTIPVNANDINTLQIIIADVSDSSYDSSLLIAADSLQTSLIANTDTVNVAPDGTKTVNLLANDTNTTGGTLTITHIAGQTAVVGVPITLGSGQIITLNSDGTVTVEGDSDEETVNLTYQVESSTGTTDTGFITINQAPCFAAGTFILTPFGEVPVEHIAVDDLVETMDNGPQPVRWHGSRTVDARGKFAPILIDEGTFGDHRALTLSPLHRVLISGAWSELLFGEEEVLIKARDLVNGKTIRQLEGGTVEYHHLLFDDHQIVFSEKLATESYLPGPQTSASFDPEIVKELCALFPELKNKGGTGYGQMARPGLKTFEVTAMANWALAS
ncbi:Hint domain-containing protein [Shimia isoporae]|uniref:Hint domain-containing protein n=1 Tax=Shimia isoporae TaxID=647720 RepID=A0A4R1N9Z2_9RHOB|nr:choice-of-anchor L domain-containing protein [Shimia isoporae]TCK99964.1 Hint domain-containing protein [Shimia isoporae]